MTRGGLPYSAPMGHAIGGQASAVRDGGSRLRSRAAAALWCLLLVASVGLGSVRLRTRLGAVPQVRWAPSAGITWLLAPYGDANTAGALEAAFSPLPAAAPIVVVGWRDEPGVTARQTQLVFATSLLAAPRPVVGVFAMRTGTARVSEVSRPVPSRPRSSSFTPRGREIGLWRTLGIFRNSLIFR